MFSPIRLKEVPITQSCWIVYLNHHMAEWNHTISAQQKGLEPIIGCSLFSILYIQKKSQFIHRVLKQSGKFFPLSILMFPPIRLQKMYKIIKSSWIVHLNHHMTETTSLNPITHKPSISQSKSAKPTSDSAATSRFPALFVSRKSRTWKIKTQITKKHLKHFPSNWLKVLERRFTSQREEHETRVLWIHGLTSNREMRSLCGSLVPTILKTLGIVSLLHFRSPPALASVSSIVILMKVSSLTHLTIYR